METEDTIDHTKVASYGSVDVRRKKEGDESSDIKVIDEDALLEIQNRIEEERNEKMREVAEKELVQKEMQLVGRRIGEMDFERNKGFVHKVASLAKRTVKVRVEGGEGEEIGFYFCSLSLSLLILSFASTRAVGQREFRGTDQGDAVFVARQQQHRPQQTAHGQARGNPRLEHRDRSRQRLPGAVRLFQDWPGRPRGPGNGRSVRARVQIYQ